MLHIGIDGDPANTNDPEGIETYVNRLLGALGRVDTTNAYRVYLRQRPRPHFPALPANFRISVIPAPILWHQLCIPFAQARDRNDIMFFPVHRIPMLPMRGLVVGTIHDTAFLHRPDSYPLFRRVYLSVFTRMLARRSCKVVAISEATAAAVRRDYGLPAERVTVIRHGWDRELAEPVDFERQAEVRRRHGIERPYMLSVGTLRPGKNLARLIEAFAGVARNPAVPPHDLVLVGKDDWPHGATRATALRFGLGDRVHITGYVSRADLVALLQGASALAFPSLHEGFGLPALEAMGAGVPVVASRQPALVELLGDAAVTFDALDAGEMAARIAEVFSDAALRERLSAAGRARAAQFTWEETARLTVRVFQEVARS